MAIETKQLHALSKIYKEAVYGGAKKEAPKDNRLVVTAADKKANTKAYQNYKAGNKAYKAADHLKDDVQYATEAKKGRRWQDDDCDDKWYEKSDVDGKISKREKKAQEKHYAKETSESMQHRRNPEGTIKDRFKSRQTDPSKDNFTGIGDSIEDIMKQNAAMKKAAAKKTKKESYSDWRQDLKEIPDYDQIPVDSKKSNEKISEKKVKNSVKINPTMEEETQVDEGVYEKQKTKEVMGALKKRDLKTSVKKKIAADIVKKKGDTSKSDDRYAYESKLWDEVAANLTELGEMNDVEFRVVGLDEAERDLGDRLHRKRKLYDRTVTKAMDYARREGEAAGHARYRMGQLDREMDKVKDKMKKEK